MKTTIGKFDPETRTVPVKFEHDDVIHRRSVNACLAEGDAYDAKATKDRVADVARGVEHKIAIGVIRNEPTPLPEPAPAPGAPSAE